MFVKTFLLKPLLLLCLTAFFATGQAQTFVAAGNKKLSYSGRIAFEEKDAASIYWGGSSVVLRFKGTGASAIFRDKPGNNHFYVIVDGDGNNAVKLKLDTTKRLYPLVKNLPYGEHSIELFKISNISAATLFYGFEIDGEAKILKPAKKPRRKIEFYGNSITAGHGVDVPVDSADSGKPEFFNNYRSYGAITARHFNAQYHCTAVSGIGVMVSWFPDIMPEVYDRIDRYDSKSQWDFSNYQPDIVVVNLFQNDSYLVTQTAHEQFKRRFGTTLPTEDKIITAYADFIRTLRRVYPNANIICCLGNMGAVQKGSKWSGYIDAAVASLKDKKVVTHFFEYKNTPGHPKAKEQEAMANSLIGFIESKYWK